MPRLTKRRIDALPAREKEYFVWDDTLKSFGARVYPSVSAIRRLIRRVQELLSQ